MKIGYHADMARTERSHANQGLSTVTATVFFASDTKFPIEQENLPAAIITPSTNNWNDFGHRLLVQATIVNKQGNRILLKEEIKLLVSGQLDSSALLRSIRSPLESEGSRFNGRAFAINFGNKGNYEAIFSHLGKSASLELLLALRDSGAVSTMVPIDEEMEKLSKVNGFYDGLLRASEAFVVHAGFKTLFEEFFTKTLAPLSSIEFPETVSGTRQILSLDFTRDHFGSNNSHVFIGPNGCGKTRLLVDLSRHLMGINPQGIQQAPADLQTYNRRVLVLTHEKSRWTDVEASGAMVKSIAIQGDAWTECTKLLFDLVKAGNIDDSELSWKVLFRTLGNEIPLKGLHFPVTHGDPVIYRDARGGLQQHVAELRTRLDTSTPPIFRDTNGNEVELSSGQKLILIFLLNLHAHLPRHGVIVIDEPETHLHPSFVATLMMSLDTSLQAKEAVAAIATHSPYVVRHVSKKCVTVLQRSRSEEAFVDFLYPTFQTRGGDIEQISEYVFEIDAARTSLLVDRIGSFLSTYHEHSREFKLKTISEEFGEIGLQIARSIEQGEN